MFNQSRIGLERFFLRIYILDFFDVVRFTFQILLKGKLFTIPITVQDSNVLTQIIVIFDAMVGKTCSAFI